MILSAEELLFFAPFPEALPLYQALRNALEENGWKAEAKVAKTQISLRNRHVFATASLPWRKRKGLPEVYLMISFGLPYEERSPRIYQSVEPYPGRWTHHVPVTQADQVDGRLLAWLGEAYAFAMRK